LEKVKQAHAQLAKTKNFVLSNARPQNALALIVPNRRVGNVVATLIAPITILALRITAHQQVVRPLHVYLLLKLVKHALRSVRALLVMGHNAFSKFVRQNVHNKPMSHRPALHLTALSVTASMEFAS
jgi:hypothetical protein